MNTRITPRPYILCFFILPSRRVMTVYNSPCTASFTHLQSAVRNGKTSVLVNGFVLAVMITGKIFLTGYEKQIALTGVKMLSAQVPAGTQHFSWELNIAS